MSYGLVGVFAGGVAAGLGGYLARAGVYVSLAYSAGRIVTGSGAARRKIRRRTRQQPKGRRRPRRRLQKLAHQSYGSYLLGLTAAGLIAYATYCFFDARYRDLTQ